MLCRVSAHGDRFCDKHYSVGVRANLSARLPLTSLVLVALIGTWLGHAIEYGVVAGWRGVELGLWGPLHSYMGPAALLLLVAAFALSLRVAALAAAAQRRAEVLWRQLRHGMRDDVTPSSATASLPWTESHGIALFLIIAGAQVVLYLVQENVEAALAGAPAPGVGAITGAHWTAPLVQVAVASCLTLGWLVASRLLRRRLEAGDRIEALFSVIARGRRRLPTRRMPPMITAPSRRQSRAWPTRPPPVFSTI